MNAIKNLFLWIQQGFKRSFDFKGRSCRREFFSFLCFSVFISLILEILLKVPNKSIALIVALASIVIPLILLIPNISILARRLHDTNRTAKWIIFYYLLLFFSLNTLIWIFVDLVLIGAQHIGITRSEIQLMNPDQIAVLINTTIDSITDNDVNAIMLPGILFIISTLVFSIIAITLICFSFMRGTAGNNRFGAPHDYLDCKQPSPSYDDLIQNTKIDINTNANQQDPFI